MTRQTDELDSWLRDAQIAVGRALGLSLPEIGKAIQTNQHPAGVTDRTVSSRLKDNKQFIEPLAVWMSALVKNVRSSAIADLTKEDIKHIAAERGWKKLFELLDSQNESIALSVAKDLVDRTEGKALQTINNVGKIEHEHSHRVSLLPADFNERLTFFSETHKLAPVQAQLPAADVLEAEVV